VKLKIAFAAALGILVLILTSAARTPNAISLRSAVGDSGILISTAVDPAFFVEPAYSETISEQFNMIEPEWNTMFCSLQPSEGHFNFGPADRVVDFALARGMKVHGHPLVWNPFMPAWVAGKTPAQLSAIIHNHIAKVLGHFKGKISEWNVVNEAFDVDGSMNWSLFYDKPGIGFKGKGTGYVEQMFRWAREADPSAKLFYNDIGADELNPKSDAIYRMVIDFKKRGVPIDGVGFQMHVGLGGFDFKSVAANLARFTALGVEVQITELDVAIPQHSFFGELRQARVYRDAVNVCKATRGCTAIQIWGFTDKHSWIPKATRGQAGDALPFDPTYHPKAAYFAMLKALEVKQ
jgi:endo-1,4-beta-xylanase